MTTQYLQLKNGKIAYDETGSGPLVICAPSLGDVRGEYRFLAPQLASAGWRVVQVDLRGLGESSAGWPAYTVDAMGGDLVELMRKLDAGPAVLIGTSMSAASAVWAAVEAPQRVAGLVVIGPAVRGEPSPLFKLLIKALFSRPWGPSAWVRYFKSLFPTRKPGDLERYSAALLANLKEPGRIEATRQMSLEPKDPATERLGKVSVPALAIIGSKDPDFKDPAAEVRWVAESLHSPYEIVQDAGHYPHAEMPEITAPLILSFLETLKEKAGLKHAA